MAGRAKIPRPNARKVTPEVIEQVLTRLSSGETLTSICMTPGIPSPRALHNWINDDPALASRFAQARLDGFDAIAEHGLRIADGEAENEKEDIQRSKLRVETRLKLLARWDPKRYGERQIHQGDDDAPAIKTATTIDFSSLGPAERKALKAILAAAASASKE